MAFAAEMLRCGYVQRRLGGKGLWTSRVLEREKLGPTRPRPRHEGVRDSARNRGRKVLHLQKIDANEGFTTIPHVPTTSRGYDSMRGGIALDESVRKWAQSLRLSTMH